MMDEPGPISAASTSDEELLGDIDTIADAIEAIRHGEMVIVTDDRDRENEGDLTVAAQ